MQVCPQAALNLSFYKRTRAKNVVVVKSRKLAAKNAKLQWHKHVIRLEEKIQVAHDNEIESAVQFEENLKSLTAKQQMQVRACFEASKRKVTNGMKFEKGWILEYIMMHTKSPRMYQHFHPHKLMVVPSPSCLQTC